MADLTSADAVAISLAWLRQHTGVLQALGGADHITGLLEAPWPHVVVSPSPGGDLRGLRWDTVQEVSLDVHDDPAGTLGQAGLWRLAVLCATALTELPDREFAATEPVVCEAEPSGSVIWSPLETGQGRWQVSLSLVVHPPHSV